MPVPIIVAAAAAAAARLAAKKVAQAAGKQVVKATLGKQSAAKYAAQKAAANTKTVATSSRNAKKAAETRAALKAAKNKPPLATPKSNVTVKPARKPVGNPPNMTKSTEEMLSSASRGGVGRGSLGKAKTARKFSTSAGRGKMDVRKPARMPDEPARATVKINSAKTTRVVRVSPKKVLPNTIRVSAADRARFAERKAAANPKKASRPATKISPNKPDAAKTQFKNDSSRTRASDRAMKEFEQNVRAETGGRPKDPSYSSKLGERAGLNTKLKRKPNLNIK